MGASIFFIGGIVQDWRWLRDVTLFVGGLVGVIHETVFTSLERPSLLVLFAAMMGLPAFFRKDEK